MKVLSAFIVVLAAAILITGAHAESKGYVGGQEEARKDIKAGELKYMLYGQPRAHDQVFANVLKKKYKITLIIAGGCDASGETRERADGYNNIILEHLAEVWKKNIIKEAEEKARKQWEQEHAVAGPGPAPNPIPAAR